MSEENQQVPPPAATPAETPAEAPAAGAEPAAPAEEAAAEAPSEPEAHAESEAPPAAPKVSLKTRLGQMIPSAKEGFKDLVAALKSPDQKTRRMAWVFFISLSFMLVAGGLTWNRQRLQRKYHRQLVADRLEREKKIKEFFEEREREAHKIYKTFDLGDFNVQLKPTPGREPAKGLLGVASLEISVECDAPKTCEHFEGHAEQARNAVIETFRPLSREEMSSRIEREKLKDALRARLNRWLEETGSEGKVRTIYFTKLVIS